MRSVLRAIPMALIYAVLTGPADPLNWLAGAVLGLALALPSRGGRQALPAREALALAARMAVLPWFLAGCVARIAGGTVTVLRVLLLRGGRAEPVFVRCRGKAETPDAAALLGLVQSASPDSIVSGLDGGGMRSSVLPADGAGRHCADQERWYRRFQRRMLP